MNQPMTLQQMLETGRPAYTQDLSYCFVPGKGFARASFTRFSPAWLPCPIPSGEDRWYHEETCDCRICGSVATAAEPATNELVVA